MSFRGVFTALVTPFQQGDIDWSSFQKLIERQIAAGVDGIVPVGTTGESPTLSHEEHCEVIAKAVQFAAGRCKVVAGTGSNSTSEAVSLTRAAFEAGVDGALLVAPYYNKPSQEGLFRHFRAIAQATPLPLMLYSIPGRCGIEISAGTVAKLAEACPTIRCIKEAGGSVERVSLLRSMLDDTFTILSGDDSLTLPFLSVGAEGVVSVASNLVPELVVRMTRAFLDGQPAEALCVHRQLYPLFKDLFIETNPVPVKFALSTCGWCTPEVRLPLCELSPDNAARLTATLTALKLT